VSANADRLDALLEESRRFAPPQAFAARAVVRDPEVYARAAADPQAYWAERARELVWQRPFTRILEWEPPHARWFSDGTLNASVNCIDRHLDGPRRNKAAIIWEGEPGDRRVLTYQMLSREVNRFANVLRSMGVRRGDRVTLYLPMIPELPIAMLACARIGAPHSVVFGGFSAEALRDRIQDCGARVLITADAGYRRGNLVPLKAHADRALAECPDVRHVVVVERVGIARSGVRMQEGRDRFWHDLMTEDVPAECPPEEMAAEDLLFILYTSGTTGKPKGIVHTTGGYLTGTRASTRDVFDLRDEDVYWCTADIGWVTGHSYVIYGPLANGATTLMYEGAPDWPDRDRMWRIVERYGVNILYTAPTSIRTFMRWGTAYPDARDLSPLRLLGSVGEPINPEAWMWYRDVIGHGRCPVVDTWWQTETGSIMISPLPGLTDTKPGSATRPLPGIAAEVVDASGSPVPAGHGGYLVITQPWPSMLRTVFGDDERYRATYWSRFPGVYFTGDGARKDEDGYIWLLGRVDDVLNVAGHRIGTMEVESALVDHPSVAEAAVIGKSHEVKGQAVSAFVTIKEGIAPSPALAQELKAHVAEKIGPIARPDDIFFTAELPKTRSGKIMRRLLRDIAEGRALGDTTTLADATVVEQLKTQYEERGETD
jgi:acetyl-CoA synthetase